MLTHWEMLTVYSAATNIPQGMPKTKKVTHSNYFFVSHTFLTKHNIFSKKKLHFASLIVF
jgi:hypothetical protein